MDLNVLWFILIAVLFTGFFFLEGFDYGVGILVPFLGKNDGERRAIINSIGPFWDGNEVWMLTAGGALFAAFPHWYATLFSGFYLALFLILVALILRGVAFEFRSKDERPAWRNFWDWMLCLGSLLPALLWGVAMANLIRGVPIDGRMQYAGTFFDLLSPYTLLGGLAFLLVFLLQGALFLTLKTGEDLPERARQAGLRAGSAAAVVFLLLVIQSYSQTDISSRPLAAPALWGALVTLVLAWWLLRSRRYGGAFFLNGLTIILGTAALFSGLFPRVMVSSLNPEWSLTIYRASSSPYTLKVMTIVALTLVPVVLIYQAWTYWVFRQRVKARDMRY
ncbi:cytochrome d ubiquinol oxidase subunit II [Moorella sp. Hama-1]|uniref:cytochrome d ubiquinol oxidase subunit II n=1 Tax=Moorella sp. Hama-1 TaxID=2138101 RepID=UPI000D64298B|nr:cytochrome d ubiquinol oxidase subunit II [Moorella sp. Hama-1]MDN5361626.1 cytochrome bd ubiquinol oxidase subunit [Moorella sp. (in: firmicutes)]BCV22644.1 cytochrome c oxidase assembly protein [Moorella sp. Hama-1]